MDGTQFDLLTRSIAQRLSRRLTFKALTAGLAAGALSQVDVEPAEAARCQSLGKSCKKRRGKPRPKCCAGSVCRGNRCQCKPGRQKCGNKCITKKQCCRNNDCPNNQRCDKKTNKCGCGKNQKRCGGRCVPTSQCCPGEKPCNGTCIGANEVCEMRVTPSNLHDWIPRGEDPFSPPELTTFVSGPGDPPLGNGSVELDPENSDQQAVIRTLKYVGQKISDITNLSYSVYVPEGGDPPTMQLAVLGAKTGEDAGFTSLIYVPGAGTNPDPVTNTWATYDTLDGQWQATRNIFGPNDECLICRANGPRTGSCADDGACVGKEIVDWSDVLNALPDAYLNGESIENGGFSFRIGRGDTGQGNLTNVRFNNDLYYFEPDN